MRDGGKGDSPRPMKDRQTYSDNWDNIFKEKDGSFTINVNCGEITIGENHDKERQETTDTDD